jgi:hypothetical protein
MDPARHGLRAAASRVLAIGAAVAALVSAGAGLRVTVPALQDARRYWSALPASQRDDQAAQINGFGHVRWDEIARLVGPNDSVAVVTRGDAQYDLRNYASYRLLPALVVLDEEQADFVVYDKVHPPPGICTPVGEGVCIAHER